MEKLNLDALASFKAELEKYFQDCSMEGFELMQYPASLAEADRKSFNENLELSGITGLQRETILNGLLRDNGKINFVAYLLATGIIDLEVSNLDIDGQTVFMRLSAIYIKRETYQLGRAIGNLFYRGYCICEADLKFLQGLYSSRLTSEEFLNWSRLRFAALINDGDNFLYALKKQKVLFALLSIKMGRPVYFNLPNLLGVVGNAIHHYPDCGDIIFRAMEAYSRKKAVEALDMKKRNFAKKKSDYILNKPEQDTRFEEIAKIVYPELSLFLKG